MPVDTNPSAPTTTGPQADLNLGIHLFLNGSPIDAIQLETTQAATDTIDYVVTGRIGLTSTTTRTSLIEADPTAAAEQVTSTAQNPPSDPTATSSPNDSRSSRPPQSSLTPPQPPTDTTITASTSQ